jgi:hypothetical protein
LTRRLGVIINSAMSIPNWQTPHSYEASDALLAVIIAELPLLEEEDLSAACQQIAIWIGSFNHFWTRQHRKILMKLLVDVGEEAIDPVLAALVEIPRAEQFDVTRAFISNLIANYKENQL